MYFLKHSLREKNFPHVHITHMLNKSISVPALVHGLWHRWGRKLRLPSPASHHHSPLQDLHSYAPMRCIYNQAHCASSPSYAELIEMHTFPPVIQCSQGWYSIAGNQTLANDQYLPSQVLGGSVDCPSVSVQQEHERELSSHRYLHILVILHPQHHCQNVIYTPKEWIIL